jgi:hypothetical protein
MADTNLITQAVVAGLDAAIAQVQANLIAANANFVSVTNDLTNALNSHKNLTYASSHGGILANTGDYRDSGNDQVGNRIITIVIGSSTYFVPASPDPAGVCHSQCHSACHSDCNCHSACDGFF